MALLPYYDRKVRELWFSEDFGIYNKKKKFLATVGLMALQNPKAALSQLVAMKI